MLHSAIHKYKHALGQLVPLLGCTVIGHSQGELARGTEKNKLSGQPCCINEGDGKTWQPNHVNHGAPGRSSKPRLAHQPAGS